MRPARGLAVLAGLLALAGVPLLVVSKPGSLEREIERLHASGLLEELPAPAPLEVERARDEVHRIGQALFAMEQEERGWFVHREERTAQRSEELWLALDERDELLRGLLEACEHPAVAESLPDAPFAGPTPRLAGTRSAVNALSARAWMHSRENGGSYEVARSLRAAFDLALVVDCGDIISLDIRRCVEFIASDTCVKLLEDGSLEAGVLRDVLMPSLERAERPGRWRMALALDASYLAGLTSYQAAGSTEAIRLGPPMPGEYLLRLRTILDQWEDLGFESDGKDGRERIARRLSRDGPLGSFLGSHVRDERDAIGKVRAALAATR